jgi:hypothetical protein
MRLVYDWSIISYSDIINEFKGSHGGIEIVYKYQDSVKTKPSSLYVI